MRQSPVGQFGMPAVHGPQVESAEPSCRFFALIHQFTYDAHGFFRTIATRRRTIDSLHDNMPELEHQKKILMRLALCISQNGITFTPPVSSEMLLSVPTSVPTRAWIPSIAGLEEKSVMQAKWPQVDSFQQLQATIRHFPLRFGMKGEVRAGVLVDLFDGNSNDSPSLPNAPTKKIQSWQGLPG